MLDAIESSIRRAVAAGAYEEADRLLALFCEQLTASSDQMARDSGRSTELFDWVFRMVSAAKAHDAAQLTAIERVRHYRLPKADPGPTWRLQG